jgi:hypothetical protein
MIYRMRHRRRSVLQALGAIVPSSMLLGSAMTFASKASESDALPPFAVGFKDWHARTGDLANWTTDGIQVASDGTLRLDPGTMKQERDPYAAGSYERGNFYNGGSYWVGEAVSPVVAAGFGFQGVMASWNADTPAGTWLETLVRAERTPGSWTRWYNIGIWAADTSTIQRHSLKEEEDDEGIVYTDLLVLKETPQGGLSYQVKLRLFSQDDTVSPRVRRLGAALSNTPVRPAQMVAGSQQYWGTEMTVPTCSQMVYPDGGEVWCSPTSLAMVLAYWRRGAPVCEPGVRAAVDGVYDWIYDGHGNWVFNTAHAATHGLEAVVARFTSFADLEPWIGAEVPIIFSFAWKEGELDDAPLPKSNGHLAVLVGFDGQGDPIVNDPAASADGEVRRVYPREQLERLWLGYTGGTVYLVHPPDWSVPTLG